MPPDSPDLTVVVTSPRGTHGRDRTLRTLAAQTVPASRVEVVVVDADDGPERAAGGPYRAVRHLRVPDPGDARAAGMAVARGTYVTVVDAGDTLSANCLESLLAVAAPDVVGIAHVVETDGPDGALDFGLDSRLARTLAAEPGPDAVPVAVSTIVGTILPTQFGRAVGLEAKWGTGVDDAAGTEFLARVVRRFDLEVRFCPPAASAYYYRESGHADQDPDVAIERELDVVDRLVAAGDDRVLLRPAVQARVDALNRVLRRYPGRHADVVARVHARGLREFDWARLNHGLARDLAIVYAALPFVDTSGNIAARRIRAAATVVDVVSADLSAFAAVDESATALWAEYVGDLHRVTGRATTEGDWAPTARFCRVGLEIIADAERAKGSYRSVYSRTMFPAAHLLAGLYKIRHPETPWLAEFSDPQQRDSRGGLRRSTGPPDARIVGELTAAMTARGFDPPADPTVWAWCELATYALADTILFTNARQRDYMLGYCADRRYADRAAELAVVSHHPQPPPELYAHDRLGLDLDPRFAHVAYFGTFYRTRSITEVVTALGLLDPAVRARIRLHVFTKKPERLRDELRHAGLDDVLVVAGYLAFTDYLAMTTRVDVLIVSDYRTAGTHDVNPYLPAKYADYLGSGRPIWGIVEPGSVLSDSALDYRSELGDAEGARRVLTRIAADTAGQPLGARLP